MPYVERANEPTLYYELDDYTDPWKKAPILLAALRVVPVRAA